MKRKSKKNAKQLQVSCPYKIQKKMLANLCATARYTKLYPERASRAKEILAALEKTNAVESRQSDADVKNAVAIKTPELIPEIAKPQRIQIKRFVTALLSRLVSIFRIWRFLREGRIGKTLMKHA